MSHQSTKRAKLEEKCIINERDDVRDIPNSEKAPRSGQVRHKSERSEFQRKRELDDKYGRERDRYRHRDSGVMNNRRDHHNELGVRGRLDTDQDHRRQKDRKFREIIPDGTHLQLKYQDSYKEREGDVKSYLRHKENEIYDDSASREKFVPIKIPRINENDDNLGGIKSNESSRQVKQFSGKQDVKDNGRFHEVNYRKHNALKDVSSRKKSSKIESKKSRRDNENIFIHQQLQTASTLNARFKQIDACKKFTFDENITIGIHRQLPRSRRVNTPPSVSYDIDLNKFHITHQRNEGQRPIFMRDEILMFIGTRNSDHKIAQFRRDLDKNTQHSFLVCAPDRHRPRKVKYHRSQIEPLHSMISVNPVEEMKLEKNALPDFSKRPGRFSYEYLQPEYIPRGPGYFDHDNREEFVMDRPRYWGRGNFGRGYPPRGNFMRRNADRSRSNHPLTGSDGVWKHDLFEALEQGSQEPA